MLWVKAEGWRELNAGAVFMFCTHLPWNLIGKHLQVGNQGTVFSSLSLGTWVFLVFLGLPATSPTVGLLPLRGWSQQGG